MYTIPIMAGVWQANMAALYAASRQTPELAKKYLGRMSQFVNSRAGGFLFMEKQLCFHLIPVCVILVLTGISLAAPDKIGIGLNKDRVPIGMVDHIKSSGTRGNPCSTSMAMGGFLVMGDSGPESVH
ncbi:MAG: hypothetical protein U5K27_13780 [Desulfotignum sp.]|nr:hypothetical protein [Desulfotignum sp.]